MDKIAERKGEKKKNFAIFKYLLYFNFIIRFPLLFQSQNSEYFSQYLTEDIHDYIARKRYLGVHGNHLEIQALSEMYNRPIHIYCYSAEHINIFQVSIIKSNLSF